MGIILEGPDASGKSTLARLISEKSGRDLHLSGGAPKDDNQMWQMINEQHEKLLSGLIVDRVSCISQQIYREGLFLRSDLQECSKDLVNDRTSLLVYCRPPDSILLSPNYHVWKDYDTEEWKAQILANQANYIARYDLLMSLSPCLVFDWTDESSTHLQSLLCEFNNPIIFDRLIEMSHKGK